MSARRILLLGAPGAGKGTQAARLCARLEVPHVSTGDMLRTAVQAGTEVGGRAKAVMESGKLVSDEIVIAIAEERLQEADAAKGFVLDGFPRTLAQAEALDAMLERLAAPLDCCLALTVETAEVVERLLGRAEIEGRPDDNEKAIRERMKAYEHQTAPLFDYYQGKGLLVEVAGLGTIDGVSDAIEKALA